MKRIVVAAFAAVLGLGLMVQDVEAKRLGGGKSVGMSRDASAMKTAPTTTPPSTAAPAAAAPAAVPAAAAAAAPAAAAATAKSGMSKWMGPLAGLAAGIGLAALLSHFGMGEAVANFLMIALLVIAAVFIIRMIFRKKAEANPQAPMQYAGAGSPASPVEYQPARFDNPGLGNEAGPGAAVGAGGTAVAKAPSGGRIPADFDVDGFIRHAKLNFVRLQAANDRGDMDDIKQFTVPEVFAEIQMQYQERGRSAQQTDVLDLHAELLDLAEEPTNYIATVRFHGRIQEDAHSAPEAFDELWHLSKLRHGGGWMVAGIQQFQ